MSLTDKIEEVIEGSKKRNNEPEIWETLKKKLKKRGFNYEGDYFNCKDLIIEGISSVGANRFLKFWDAINEYLNKNNHRWINENEKIKKSFEVMKTLSEIDDIVEVIKTIAEIGYEIPTCYNDQVFLNEEILNLFNALAKDEMYKEYASIFRALKRVGYKDIKSYDTSGPAQLDYLTKIACLKKDAVGAIYVLASKGYQIDKVGGISTRDLKNIEKIVGEDKEEKSEGKGGIPVYLYNTGNVELFQDYFTSLKIGDKKSVLKSILDHETVTEWEKPSDQNREWLEKNYEGLIKELTFTN